MFLTPIRSIRLSRAMTHLSHFSTSTTNDNKTNTSDTTTTQIRTNNTLEQRDTPPQIRIHNTWFNNTTLTQKNNTVTNGKQLSPFSTTTNDNDKNNPSSKPPPLPFIVQKLNHSIEHHPAECAASLVGLDIVLIFGCYQAIQLTGIQFSAEFALAFAVSRPLRKLRLPFEIAAAAGLSKLVPSLKHIELAKLSQLIPASVKEGMSQVTTPDTRMGRSAKYMKDVLVKHGKYSKANAVPQNVVCNYR
jgi:hypothetical protein